MDGRRKRKEEERGERKEGKGNTERTVGEIVQGQIDKSLIPSFPARSADTSIFGSSDPTYSPFSASSTSSLSRHTWHRSRFLSFPCPSPQAMGAPLPSLSPSTPSDAFAFAASPRSTYIGALLSHSFPFCHMNPSCMRLFPHVVLIIYTFSISRLFFSQLFRSVRRGFHLTPLSTYMRGDAPGISPNASLIPYPFRA